MLFRKILGAFVFSQTQFFKREVHMNSSGIQYSLRVVVFMTNMKLTTFVKEITVLHLFQNLLSVI